MDQKAVCLAAHLLTQSYWLCAGLSIAATRVVPIDTTGAGAVIFEPEPQLDLQISRNAAPPTDQQKCSSAELYELSHTGCVQA